MRTFTDNRGTITNILQEECKNVALITSTKGSVRSNHWHKKDSHHIFVLSGKLQYDERDLDGSNSTSSIFYPNEKFFTPPNKVHRVLALEDSVFLSLSKEPQTEERHAEDCIPEQF